MTTPADWPHPECPTCGDAADVQPVESGEFLYCHHCVQAFGHREPAPWDSEQAFAAIAAS